MRCRIRYGSVFTALLAAGCLMPQKDESLRDLDRTLRKQLGELSDPDAGFIRDSTHLLIVLATAAFPTVSDDRLTSVARDISRYAYHRYERAGEVDSVSFFLREKVRRGVGHIRHTRSFAVAELGDSTATSMTASDRAPH